MNKHEGYTELPDEESKIYTMPTEKNPLMNVSLLDYTENNKREKAAPYNLTLIHISEPTRLKRISYADI